MQKNIYLRIKGREILRLNLTMIAGGLLLAGALGALALCLGGCAYRVIPEKAAAQVEAVPPGLRKQATAAQGRAEGHRTAAAAAQTTQEARAHAAAAAEAEHGAKVENAAAGAVAEGMGQSQPVAEFVIDQAAPVIQPALAAATAATGIPWGEIVTVATSALGLGGLTVNRHLAARKAQKERDCSDQAHAWEDAICSDPDFGSDGTINYNDPKTLARAKSDLQRGYLSKNAFKKMYPDGV